MKGTPWQIACKWYDADEIHRSILGHQRRAALGDMMPPIPADVTSREFAEWLCNEYRLAMAKGIQLTMVSGPADGAVGER